MSRSLFILSSLFTVSAFPRIYSEPDQASSLASITKLQEDTVTSLTFFGKSKHGFETISYNNETDFLKCEDFLRTIEEFSRMLKTMQSDSCGLFELKCTLFNKAIGQGLEIIKYSSGVIEKSASCQEYGNLMGLSGTLSEDDAAQVNYLYSILQISHIFMDTIVGANGEISTQQALSSSYKNNFIYTTHSKTTRMLVNAALGWTPSMRDIIHSLCGYQSSSGSVKEETCQSAGMNPDEMRITLVKEMKVYNDGLRPLVPLFLPVKPALPKRSGRLGEVDEWARIYENGSAELRSGSGDTQDWESGLQPVVEDSRSVLVVRPQSRVFTVHRLDDGLESHDDLEILPEPIDLEKELQELIGSGHDEPQSGSGSGTGGVSTTVANAPDEPLFMTGFLDVAIDKLDEISASDGVIPCEVLDLETSHLDLALSMPSPLYPYPIRRPYPINRSSWSYWSILVGDRRAFDVAHINLEAHRRGLNYVRSLAASLRESRACQDSGNLLNVYNDEEYTVDLFKRFDLDAAFKVVEMVVESIDLTYHYNYTELDRKLPHILATAFRNVFSGTDQLGHSKFMAVMEVTPSLDTILATYDTWYREDPDSQYGDIMESLSQFSDSLRNLIAQKQAFKSARITQSDASGFSGGGVISSQSELLAYSRPPYDKPIERVVID